METVILNTLVFSPQFSTILLMRYSMIYPTIGTDGDRSQGAMDDVWAPVGVAAVLVDTKWKNIGYIDSSLYWHHKNQSQF